MGFIFKHRKQEEATRILFATDIHGSEGTWRKFLNAAAMLDVDVAICGGDLTGKMIVPIVERKNGKYTYYHLKKTNIIEANQLEKAIKEIKGIGYYPYVTNEDEYEEMARNPKKVDEIFRRVMLETLEEWFKLIPQKLPEGVKVIVCPGNDDRFDVDEVIEKSRYVINGEGRVIEINEHHEMISCGWVNPTPWKTTREEEDEKLEERLEKYISQLKNPESAIFNFHAPPYQSKIDEAPLLDENLNPIIQQGRVVMVPVGSKAVRKMIEKYKPFLSLHGHIHESPGCIRIGRTYCVNPGSEYAEGILRAFFIEFKGNKITRLQRIEG
ncbi:MAG: metallophosphoesterase [Candidatus Bathyarchaeia archaeon]